MTLEDIFLMLTSGDSDSAIRTLEASEEDGEPAEAFGVAAVVVDEDTAEIEVSMTAEELKTLTGELDKLCEKFPDRA